LNFLREKELIQIEKNAEKNEPDLYITTERGRAFLKAYNDLKATMRKNRRNSALKYK
jgi:predicted transcriptional regulator